MLSDLENSPSYLLHRALQVTTSHFDRLLGEQNLTQSQILVMMAIAENAGISQKQVSEKTGIDRSTLTDVINRLVRKSYVRRQRSRSDARRYSLNLTKLGDDALSASMPIQTEIDRAILAALAKPEAADLVRALRTMIGVHATRPQKETLPTRVQPALKLAEPAAISGAKAFTNQPGE